MTYPYNDDVEEIKRLQSLLSFNILDTPHEEEFDSLVKLVSLICNSPIAIISMIDDKRQWYKAKVGLEQNEVPRDETFCKFTLEQDDLMEITDARLDERVRNNPHVTPENGIRYYAGVNIKTSAGYKIGTVCVVDIKPRELTIEQRQALKLVADQTMILLEARKKNKELNEELNEILNNKVKETQRALLQRKTEYILLLRAIRKSSAVVEFSLDGTILTVNDNFLDIIGYSREDLVGNSHNILLFEDHKGRSTDFWNSLQNGNYHAGRLKRKHKDGHAVWIHATYNPLTDHKNNITRIIKIAQDITKEIEAEKFLQNSKELAEALNSQKDNFIANMSHEIRTPIHAILGFTELLLEEETDEIKSSYLQSVKTAGDNLLYIINDILDLSKIEAGIIFIEKEPFDLLQLVKNVFSILHLKAHQKKISFQHHIEPGLNLNVVGDKNRLTQVLLNLLGNAIKFTSAGSVELYIESLKQEEKNLILQFKVVDTGIGIPAEKKDLIFDRFSQAEEDTSRNFGGTGLGLNISRQLIERMGGEIRVESEVGKGSVFSFHLPFGYSDISPEQVIDIASNESVKFRNANILLCEDNELNQRLLKAILVAKGYKIDLAENGSKGIELFKMKTYDLVLMDIQMPVMDGYEATGYIREELGSNVPILALTANFLLAERIKCKELGMNDYLTKPFSKDDLLQKVEDLLDGNNDDSKKLTGNSRSDYTLDLKTLEELSNGDKDFQKEMMILFIEQAGQMFREIKDFCFAREIPGIRSTAHKMKTSFGIIGADPKLLNELEFMNDDHESLHISNSIDLLENQLKEIFRILNDLINAPDDEDPTS